MGTVQIAKNVREAVNNEDWQDAREDLLLDVDKGTEARGVFIGTVFALDPCGRFHSMFTGEAPVKCQQFWESLERQLEKRGLSLESGEGDPCDVFAWEYRDKAN